MRSPYSTPLDQILADWWNGIDYVYKKAFFFVTGINLLAFGFEMTNLTIHHDDLFQIFIQDDILGHYLGRFGVGKLHYYGQNAYFMPFLQMLEGIVFMSVYGVLVARFWGARKVLDMTLVASIVCVFPYMAQVYQYNTSMATYSLAHLLAAAAVIVSTRGTFIHAATASLLYIAAFSIYQSIIANAATIFVVWVLVNLLFSKEGQAFASKAMLRSTIGALLSVGVGGLLYMASVSFMDLDFDSSHAAGEAFNLSEGINLTYAASEIIQGTRSFFMWPENYFPDYLKKLQLLFIAGAGIFCLLLPKSPGGKIGAVVLLVLASFTPRILQLIHPAGTYHNLTLTAYALVIAGAVLIINRASRAVMISNASTILAFFLIAGYIMQCNWISTVNHLNTLAHYTTLTQVLARARSLPDTSWDGKMIAVVGKYNTSSDYPFKTATGVAVKFMDAFHMQQLANLMRDD
ncbi:MAG: glucosyltransferase domain-containing protein, partial [Pseudomonadota bacterium]